MGKQSRFCSLRTFPIVALLVVVVLAYIGKSISSPDRVRFVFSVNAFGIDNVISTCNLGRAGAANTALSGSITKLPFINVTGLVQTTTNMQKQGSSRKRFGWMSPNLCRFEGIPLQTSTFLASSSKLYMTKIEYNGKAKEFKAGSPLSKAVTQLGCKVTYSCRKGDCATCQVVLDGRMVRCCTGKVPDAPKDKSLKLQA